MASEPNENNISCSVCGVPLDQPSPLCGAYRHPTNDWAETSYKPSLYPDKWHDHTMKAVFFPSNWNMGSLPPSPEEIKAQQLMYQFVRRIERMNLLFQIGAPTQLTNLGLHRLQQFKMVISDEVSEGCDLIQQIMVRNAHNGSSLSDVGSLDADQQLTEDEMVAFADWLGDLVVYVFSEAARWGIDLLAVLKVIMDSQDSKLGPDGKPIHDPVTNKFLKGPNYVAPEAAIKALLFPIFGVALEDSKPEKDGQHRCWVQVLPNKPESGMPYVRLSPLPIYTEIGDRKGWSSDVVEEVKQLGVLADTADNPTPPLPENDSEKSVCTCKPDCPLACKGSCGCDYCLRAYSDSLEGPE